MRLLFISASSWGSGTHLVHLAFAFSFRPYVCPFYLYIILVSVAKLVFFSFPDRGYLSAGLLSRSSEIGFSFSFLLSLFCFVLSFFFFFFLGNDVIC